MAMATAPQGEVDALCSTHRAFETLPLVGFSFDRIEAILCFYDEPHRRYHDRQHLREMLDALVDIKVNYTPAQVLAVLLHDAIYVPGAPRGTNEAMSAHLLRVYGSGVDSTLIERAAGIVLDTAEHIARHPEADLVLDLDLLRLAVAQSDFERHSRQVFAEQRSLIGIEDETAAWRFFESRRAPYFERLIAREHIYATAPMRQRYEQRAQMNLRQALGR